MAMSRDSDTEGRAVFMKPRSTNNIEIAMRAIMAGESANDVDRLGFTSSLSSSETPSGQLESRMIHTAPTSFRRATA